MQNFHVILVSILPWTEHKPERIKLYSHRFKHTVIVSQEKYKNGEHWLKEHKFNIVGKAETKWGTMFISDTFEPLKPIKECSL